MQEEEKKNEAGEMPEDFSPNTAEPDNQPEQEEIFSHSERDPKGEKPKKSRKRMVASVVISLFSVIFVVAGALVLRANSLLSGYHYVPDESSQSDNATSGDNQNGETSVVAEGDAYMKDGLYHDDQVMNILLLGVDDYQANDVGRSDSMLLISIDKRHQKIKVTSFMRDMYLSIPGYANNRINVAYSLGGAPLLVKTIEKNFGVDIDKYVIIDFEAFPSIIEALGGIEVNLSAGEADEINRKSGEDPSLYVTAGTHKLTSKQARYYARIRMQDYTDPETGKVYYSDYGRTKRQRHVIDLVMENLKGSDVNTLLNIANQVVPYIISNISPDEMLQIVYEAPAYLGYDMLELQMPDNQYHTGTSVIISGMKASVLIPDLEKNSQLLNHFIYEDSFEETASLPDDYTGEDPLLQK